MRYEVWLNTILCTTIEAGNREEALEKALDLNDMRIEEIGE